MPHASRSRRSHTVRRSVPLAGLALAGAFAVGAGGSPASAGASAHAADGPAPSCDGIRADTLAQTDRWRVFRLMMFGADGDVPNPIWACRREPGPSPRVLRVATDLCDGQTCSDTKAVDLVGDRLLLAETEYDTRLMERRILVDLAARRAAYVGPTGFEDRQSGARPSWSWAHLTPGGAVVVADPDPTNGQGTDSAGVWVFDGSGARHLAAPVMGVAGSRGSEGSGGGVYLHAVGGAVSRVVTSGPAPVESIASGAAAVEGAASGPATDAGAPSVPLEVRAPKNTQPRYALARQTVGVTQSTGPYDDPRGAIDAVRRTAPRTKAAAWLTAGKGDLRIRFANLALRRSEPTLLAAKSETALIRARFADRPGQLRVRLHTTERNGRALVDLPPTQVPTAPGMTAITYTGHLAVADGDTLRVWMPKPWSKRVPGVHDLAASGEHGLFFTDGSGTPRHMWIGPRSSR